MDIDGVEQRVSYEAEKTYCDFVYRVLSDAAGLLAKGTALYLAILAALSGYILASGLTHEVKTLGLILVLIVASFLIVTGLVIGKNIYRGLECLGRTLKRMNPPLYDDLGIGFHFRAWQGVAKLCIGLFALVLVGCVIGCFLLWRWI